MTVSVLDIEEPRLGINMIGDALLESHKTGGYLLNANSEPFADPADEDLIGISLTGELFSEDDALTQPESRVPGIYMYHSAFNNSVVNTSLVAVTGIGGSAKAAVNAARVSYGKDSASSFNLRDAKLLKRLFRDNHGSPLEHNLLTFKVLMPNPLFKQTLRHRVGVSFNEISGRYSVVRDRYYVPLRLRLQNPTNHQGSAQEALSEIHTLTMQGKIRRSIALANEVYHELLDMGVSKELARLHLPGSFYTEAYVTFNMRSLIHYLNLRVEAHAQYEIQEYAKMFALGAYLSFPEFFELTLDEESSVFLPGVKKTLSRLIHQVATVTPPLDATHGYYNSLQNKEGGKNLIDNRRNTTGYIRMLGN
jgi:thymidylate synthase (FAD)